MVSVAPTTHQFTANLLLALAALLSAAILVAGAAESIEIPARGTAGKCSPAPTNKVTYTATIDSPGSSGVFLLPKSDFDKLVAASNSLTAISVNINYFINYSCDGSNITSCYRTTGTSGALPTNGTVCVAIPNEGFTALSGTLDILWGDDATVAAGTRLSTGAIIGIALGSLVTLAMLVGIVVALKRKHANKSALTAAAAPAAAPVAAMAFTPPPPPETMVKPHTVEEYVVDAGDGNMIPISSTAAAGVGVAGRNDINGPPIPPVASYPPHMPQYSNQPLPGMTFSSPAPEQRPMGQPPMGQPPMGQPLYPPMATAGADTYSTHLGNPMVGGGIDYRYSTGEILPQSQLHGQISGMGGFPSSAPTSAVGLGPAVQPNFQFPMVGAIAEEAQGVHGASGVYPPPGSMQMPYHSPM